jgi:hypothetical protein
VAGELSMQSAMPQNVCSRRHPPHAQQISVSQVGVRAVAGMSHVGITAHRAPLRATSTARQRIWRGRTLRSRDIPTPTLLLHLLWLLAKARDLLCSLTRPLRPAEWSSSSTSWAGSCSCSFRSSWCVLLSPLLSPLLHQRAVAAPPPSSHRSCHPGCGTPRAGPDWLPTGRCGRCGG